MIKLVVTIGHNKSCPVSGYKRSLVGPEGQPEISCWSKGPAKV